MDAILERVKLSLRQKTTAFDSEILDLIAAALADLKAAGITKEDTNDPLIRQAVVTYCVSKFGNPDNYQDLKASYDEQKGQMQTATGYTNWGENNG